MNDPIKALDGLVDGLLYAEKYFLEQARGSQEGEDYRLAEVCHRAAALIPDLKAEIEGLHEANERYHQMQEALQNGKAVMVYDMTPADTEQLLRDTLVKMGWTAPDELRREGDT